MVILALPILSEFEMGMGMTTWLKPLFKCKMSILAITANAARSNLPPRNTEDAKWKRPGPRCIKLNVDGSYFADTNTGSVGAILRDFEGSFIAASCLLLPHIRSAGMDEATTMREGLALANNLGYSNIIAESDLLETIEACTGETRWWNESSAIFSDCIDAVSAIGRVDFKFCPREANQAAHEIARFSFVNNLSCNWVDEPPSFLLYKLVNDVTIVDD